MKVLFDVNHPAQVHLFHHAIDYLESEGHETLVTSRDKEMTLDLLDAYDIDHRPLTDAADGLLGMLIEWTVREVRLFRVARRFDPDVVVSRPNPAAAHVATLVGARTLFMKDTVLPEPMRTLIHRSTFPFVDDVCSPPGFDLGVDPACHHTLGFQELAYLHPDWFSPDPEALADHGVAVDEPYFVLRFAGWGAYHDVGNGGLTPDGKARLVSFLADHGAVYITSETELPPQFEDYRLTVPAHRIHDLLAGADLYVGDSQTMPTEAALLGTPAVRVNTVVDDQTMNNFVELEEQYGLLFSYADEDAAVAKIRDLVADEATDWSARREALLADKPDVTNAMLDLILDERVERTGTESDRPPKQRQATV
ncbi:DUF354 domain-containing protein [Halobacteriales archaeon Cl-PHB]